MPQMDDFAKLSVDDFLNQVAERTPTPGGGGVTGAAGALACALAHMVAAYSVGKRTDPAVKARIEAAASRLHNADEILRALITQDATAYADMTEAAKKVTQAADVKPRGPSHAEATSSSSRSPPRPKRAAQGTYTEAVMAAIAVPMEMAGVASEALAAMDRLKTVASRHLLSDLGIAAVLAEATGRAARYTISTNVGELTDGAVRKKLLADIDQVVAHCAGYRESIEAFVRDRLADDPANGR